MSYLKMAVDLFYCWVSKTIGQNHLRTDIVLCLKRLWSLESLLNLNVPEYRKIYKHLSNSGAIIIFWIVLMGEFILVFCGVEVDWMCFIEVCDICYDDFLGGQNVWQKSYHAMSIFLHHVLGIFLNPNTPLLILFLTCLGHILSSSCHS